MKKIATLFLALAILLTPVLGVSAYAPYVTSGVVRATPIQFSDAEGNELTSVTGGSELSASCEVKKGADAAASQQVTLICAVYDGETLVGMNQSALTLTDNSVQNLSVSLSVPADCANPAVKAYVWDDFSTLRPLTEKAIFASNNADVTEILIDGVPLEDFTAETKSYTTNLAASYLTYPEITVKTANLASNVDIAWDGRLPAESVTATITVTSADGTVQNAYTIVFNQEAAEVRNAKGITKNGTVNFTLTPNLQEPTFKTQPTAALTNETKDTQYGINNLNSYTRVYSDRNYYCIYLPKEYEGATYISTPLNWRNDLEDQTADDVVTFDINRSATIYAVVGAMNYPWISENGFVAASSDPNFYNGATFNYALATEENANLATMTNVIAKKVTLEPGEISKTVSMGAIICAVVKFDDSEMITNLKEKTSESTYTTNPMVKLLENVEEAKFKDPKVTTGNNTDYNVVNLCSAMRVSPDSMTGTKSRYMLNVPDFLIGSDVLAFNFYALTHNEYLKNGTATDVISFDIKQSATIYFAGNLNNNETNMPWLTTLGFEKVEGEELEGFRSMNYKWNEDRELQYPWNTIYKKEYKVRPGDTVTVELGGLGSGNTNITSLIFVKWNHD